MALNFADFWRPLESPFFLLGLALLLAANRRIVSAAWRRALTCACAALFYLVYRLALQNDSAGLWLYRLESPLLPPLLLLVLPALFLPRNRWYRLFLVYPALVLATALWHTILRWQRLPAEAAFLGLPAAPVSLAMGVTAALVLAQPLFSLVVFRRIVRVTLFLVLMFGGFLLRQDVSDYADMLSRRSVARRDIISFAETTPVLRDSERLSYLPAAPCRFSADGGYVQGCVMELLQRLLQLDFRKVVSGSIEERALLAMIMAAILSLSALLFIGGRLWCGWVCPLATAGAALDRLRIWLRLPHFKYPRSLKQFMTGAGVSLGSFGLMLAAAYPRLDENGRFLGCKIPLYPFCKFCPGQQVCPVASAGPDAYPPLPGREWMGGFFLVAAAVLGLFFVAAFASARGLFCRFCPMGLIGGLFNRGGLATLRKRAQSCNGCGVCHDVCPMDIPSVATDMTSSNVLRYDCLLCLECVARCPQQGCLSLEVAGRTVVSSARPRSKKALRVKLWMQRLFPNSWTQSPVTTRPATVPCQLREESHE